MTIETPCIAVCHLDPQTRLCLGCGRTLQEIGRWSQMSRAERRSIMTELSERMRKAGLPPSRQ